MKDQKHDFFGAFKQLFVLVTIVIWIGWIYMFLTDTKTGLKQFGKYGQSWYDSINANGMLFMAVLISIFTISLFFY